MIGVEIDGLVYELAGIIEVIRNMIIGLKEQGLAVSLRHKEIPYYKVALPNELYHIINNALCTPAEPHFPILQFQSGRYFQPEPGRYTIGLTMLESDRINQEWVNGCNRMPEVWVPTRFNEETFRASGVERVRTMPFGVDVHRFRPGLSPLPLPDRRSFIFLTYDWFLRKGPDLLLHAYFRTFKRDDDVLLIFKLKPDSTEVAQQGIREIAAHYGGITNTPAVRIMDSVLSWDDMPRLYSSVDCFVLPTRGEGWGLPVIEAMASGLPVICTEWSGPTQYINQDNSYPLRYDGLEPIPHFSENEICLQNGNWAKPSLDHLMIRLRHIYKHRAEARDKGMRARSFIAEHFTWDKATALMAQRIREIWER